MNSQVKIQKLEALLDRVLTRAAEPRSAAVTVASPAAAMQQLSTATTRMESPFFAEPAPRPETEPPATAAEPEMDDDVEVSSEVVEVDIDMDDPMLQSGAHEVPHGGRADEEPRPDTHRSQAPGANDEATAMATGQDEETAIGVPAANEVYEPEPSSSPRPITSDVPEESSPRHTPPPESGKQVAVTPSAPPQRKSTAPPPSLEGHTLVGGWREPGLSPQAPPVVTQGVRVPPPPGAHAPPLAPPTPPPPPMHVAPPVPQASGTRLSPEVTKPELPVRANVATVQGAVEVPRPATFGALVDASLEL